MNPIMTMRVLWLALMSSVGLFAVVIVLLPPALATPDSMHLVLFGVTAASSAAVSFVFPRRIHESAAKAASLAVSEVPDPEAPAGFGAVTRVRMFADPRAARQKAFMLYGQYTILSCALSESVGIFGIVLNRLGHPPAIPLLFVLCSLILVALRMPSEAKAIRLFESATGARLA